MIVDIFIGYLVQKRRRILMEVREREERGGERF